MPRTARSVRIRQIAESCGWTRIGTPEFAQLREQLPSVSPTDVLRSGVPADPPWRAIRQHTFPELAEFLFRDNTFVHGAFLMTGTGIVPGDDFTLRSGDEIRITIAAIGTLVNTVA